MNRYKVTAKFYQTKTIVSDTFDTYGEAVACVNAYAGQSVELYEPSVTRGELAVFIGRDGDRLFATGKIEVSA